MPCHSLQVAASRGRGDNSDSTSRNACVQPSSGKVQILGNMHSDLDLEQLACIDNPCTFSCSIPQQLRLVSQQVRDISINLGGKAYTYNQE